MRNFFMTFFSVKGLEQKIDRFVDYFHCPLEDEVDNWWEKNYTSSNTYNYIYTHSYLYNLKFIHSVHKQYPCFLLWYFQWLVLNFQTGRLKMIVMCILQNFKRNFGSGKTATHSICSLFWRRSTMLFVMLNFPILVLPHVISIVWFEKKNESNQSIFCASLFTEKRPEKLCMH